MLDVLKKKILRAKECECAVMQYLDESFEIPEDVKKTFEELDLEDDALISGRVYLWKENFLKTKGLTPFNANIDDYAKEAVEYMKATSPYCFDIDTSDLMLKASDDMLAELTLYALSLGASDEQVNSIVEWLKEEKCSIPDESINDRYNSTRAEKERISADSIAGTTIDYYQSGNLFGSLIKLNDKGISKYIRYLIKSDAMRHPQRPFNGVCVDDDGTQIYVSEGNHRVFAYKALKVIRDKVTGEKGRGVSFDATIYHHQEHFQNENQEI